MGLFEQLTEKKAKLSVVGLGYVGMPIAVAFSQKLDVIGYDSNARKIALYRGGKDPTREVGDEVIASSSVEFTSDAERLREASFHIIAVPTPVNPDNTPDLAPVESASRAVGKRLAKGSVVVYESTVYPGVTEDVCVPILERESGLVCGRDFKVGYSPERINPGDKKHRLESIVKIVSGCDAETLDTVARVYELVCLAGVHRAESIRVAEAAKVIENSQRDINIAFMNELSIIFDRMGIDTHSVLRAAGTKWNFLPFTPGLVGGHCIGVDPYYLTYCAEKLGYHSQVILAGRRINDGMGRYVAQCAVKRLIAAHRPIKGARVAILGLTFKENCPDTRNTRVMDIIEELREYGIEPIVCDAQASPEEVKSASGIELMPLDAVRGMDAVIISVAHDEYRALQPDVIAAFFAKRDGAPPVLIDVKGILDRSLYEGLGYSYWRL